MPHAALVLMFVAPLMIGCTRDNEPAAQPAAEAQLQIPDFDPQAAFRAWYEPVDYDAQPQIPGYELPQDLARIVNLDQCEWRLTDEARAIIARQGFVVTDMGNEEDITEIYSSADDDGIPPFVTVDTLLHIYHLQFDQTLKVIEETQFAPAMADFSREMMQVALEQHGAAADELQ